MKIFLRLVFVFLIVISAFTQLFDFPDEPRSLGKSADDLLSEYSSRRNDAVFLYNLGKALYERASYDAARGYLDEARNIDPKNPWILYYSGKARMALGEEAQAAEIWQAALENSYEFIPIWEELVKIRPEFYINLGLLYRDKASRNEDKELAQQAMNYLRRYLDANPGGTFESQARSGISDMEMLLQRDEAQRRTQTKQMELQRLEMERQQELDQSRRDFREKNLRMAGVHFSSFGPRKEFEFKYEGSQDIIDSVLTLRKYQVSSLSGFQFTGGYLHDKWILRGGLLTGSTNIGKQFDVDSVYSTQQEKYITNRSRVKSAKLFQVFAQVDYNFFFIDPILLYAGANVDVGTLKLDTPNFDFSSESLAGVGVNVGIMLHFSNILVDLHIKPKFLGSSSGTSTVIGAMYKF